MAKGNKGSKKVSPASTVEGSDMATTTVPTKTNASKDQGFKVLETKNVSPADLVFTDQFRGRVKPVREEIVVDRADSIRRNGQQQPIQVRPAKDQPGKYEVIFGNTRGYAGLKLLNGYTNSEGKEVKPDAKFTLRVEVVDVDDETAFLRNVVENAQRTNTSPIDNAKNQQELREKFGMSDAMITKHYGYSSQASVSRLKKLLELEEEYQNSCHDGLLTQGAAFLLADVPAGEARQKVWLAATDASKGDDTIGSTVMANAIKAWRKAEREKSAAAASEGGADQPTTPANGETVATTPAEPAGPGRPSTGTKGLTIKEVKDTVKEIAGDPACPAVVEQAMNMFLSFIEGKTDAAGFAQWFAGNLIGGDIVPEVKPEVSAEDSFNPEVNPRASDETPAE